jgi:hypothetical protein
MQRSAAIGGAIINNAVNNDANDDNDNVELGTINNNNNNNNNNNAAITPCNLSNALCLVFVVKDCHRFFVLFVVTARNVANNNAATNNNNLPSNGSIAVSLVCLLVYSKCSQCWLAVNNTPNNATAATANNTNNNANDDHDHDHDHDDNVAADDDDDDDVDDKRRRMKQLNDTPGVRLAPSLRQSPPVLDGPQLSPKSNAYVSICSHRFDSIPRPTMTASPAVAYANLRSRV